MKNDRELYASLAYLADTLVSGFDMVDLSDRLVHSCLELLDVSAAGILLTDQRGSLQVFASSSQEIEQLELLQLQSNQGPCYEAFMTGERVGPVLLADSDERWPRFAFRARESGFSTVLALPMRLRESTIGAINLFTAHSRGLSAEDVDAARALANMATIGILTHRVSRRREILADSFRRRSTAESSSSRPRASSPNAKGSRCVSPSTCSAPWPAARVALSPTSRTTSPAGGRPFRSQARPPQNAGGRLTRSHPPAGEAGSNGSQSRRSAATTPRMIASTAERAVPAICAEGAATAI